MVQRVVKATVSGWRPWAIGAAISIGCALLLAWRRRAAARAYEDWWEHREHLRTNGHPSHPQLFV